VNISSIAVLLAALIGASALGVVGAVMAIPIAATINVILSDRLRARDEEADDGANAVKDGSVAGSPVAVEVLLLSEQDELLRYRSTSAPLDSAAPDDLAAALAALDDRHGVLHSTSWRFAGDGIVLTYIALPDPQPDLPTRAVGLGQVVSSGDPQEPNASADLDSVAAHACRHLAFVADNDFSVAEAIERHRSIADRLGRLTPAVAGELPQPRSA
jgi:hypothetical protein